MRSLKDIKTSYEITEEDSVSMKKVSEVILKFKEEFAKDTQRYILTKVRNNEVFSDINMEKHLQMLGVWYEKFLIPKLSSYLSIFSYIRNWMHEKVFQNVNNDVERKNMLLTLHKFMDIEMSLISSFYTEFEIGKYTKDFSLRGFLINYSEKFSLFMHFLLVAFLIILTLGAVYALGSDLVLNF